MEYQFTYTESTYFTKKIIRTLNKSYNYRWKIYKHFKQQKVSTFSMLSIWNPQIKKYIGLLYNSEIIVTINIIMLACNLKLFFFFYSCLRLSYVLGTVDFT